MALASLIDRGYRSAELHVAANNAAAQFLYAKHGFTQIACVKNYYWDKETDNDALLMSRALP